MNYKQMWKGVDGGILTFDSIQYVLRFMIDTGVSLRSPNRLDTRLSILDIGDVLGRSSAGEIYNDPWSRQTIKLPNRSRSPLPRFGSSSE